MHGSFTSEAWVLIAAIIAMTGAAVLRMTATAYQNRVGRHDLRVKVATLRAEQIESMRAAREAAEKERVTVAPLRDPSTDDEPVEMAEPVEAVEMAELVN